MILEYRHDDTVLAAPFRRCAQLYPDGIDQVLRRVLERPSFSWASDGETLLREYKPGLPEVPRPRNLPLPERLAKQVAEHGLG